MKGYSIHARSPEVNPHHQMQFRVRSRILFLWEGLTPLQCYKQNVLSSAKRVDFRSELLTKCFYWEYECNKTTEQHKENLFLIQQMATFSYDEGFSIASWFKINIRIMPGKILDWCKRSSLCFFFLFFFVGSVSPLPFYFSIAVKRCPSHRAYLFSW